LGYIRGRKREEKIKETKEESPSMARSAQLKKGAEIIVFQARSGGKKSSLFMEISTWRENFD
jgi:hypothetical protein